MLISFRVAKTKEISLSFTLLLIAFSNFVSFGNCLYEDQIGKFDWSNHFVGKVIDGHLDDRFAQVYVSTEENVVAALSADTGAIVWRQVLERGDRGTIKYLHLISDDSTNANSIRLNNKRDDDGSLITVTGTSVIVVRGWNVRTGNLAWEWIVTPKSAVESHWFLNGSILYQVVPSWQTSSAEVFEYNARTGQVVQSAARRISLQSFQASKCDFIKSYLVCSGSDEIVSIDLRTGTSASLAKTTSRQQAVASTEAVVRIENKLYNLQSNAPYSLTVADSILHLIKKPNQQILLEASIQNEVINVKANSIETGQPIAAFETDYAKHLSVPRIIDASCKTNKRSELVCRIVLSTENGALVQIQAGKVKWIREESLANIAAIEMIDLPLADAEGAIEKQLKSKSGDIVGNFIQRATTQLNHVKHLLRTLFDVVSTHSIPETDGELTRDAFGLHTIIVVVTSTGKLFGIDNISGKHHYVTYLPNFTEFNNEQRIKIIVQRTSKHFPHPAQVSILAKHAVTGNGLLYQFNPITGKPINDGIINLNYAVRQVSVLQPGADFLQGILLLDSQNGLHVVPESMVSLAHGTYIYSADKETGIMIGYYVELQGKQLNAVEIWQNNLSGLDNSQKITQIASKNPIEHVHSQGRVLNDRSVLYKYINPNLVAVVTQGTDNVYKYVLNVHLIDVVSGSVVSTITHRRVRGPVNIIHSENWLVYTYYNDKVRRTELTAVELYEGNTQANSTVWTSFDAPPLPAVEQQSYIIPSNVVTLQETITEKGITHKHILIGLSSGGIVEMPWHLLDPRRPVLGNNQPREEGTIPYMPELPLSSESVINYNKSIARIQGIYSAPSGLESTCLVVAYGLDFFVTRVAPSKTYDLLKEDFDYFLISSVLLGLTVASFIVKQMSAKKTLKQAWK